MVGAGERGFNIVISDSAYEVSYICALATGTARSSKEWLCIKETKMAENPNTMLFVNEICMMKDGQPFLETARLTSSYVCIRLHKHV